MAELRWCIIEVKRGEKKGTYDLILGHDNNTAFGDPVPVTKGGVTELAKKLCDNPHCAARHLKGKSFLRTRTSPRTDIEHLIGKQYFVD